MQFGVHLPAFGTDPEAVVELACLAEELGFETVWVGDHVVGPLSVESKYPYTASGAVGKFPGFLDPFVSLAAVAAKTSRVRLGLSVLIVPYRNPVVTAKLIASVDVFSHGRVDVGVGAGWLAEEFAALDVPFNDRGKRTDEYLSIFKTLWSDEPASYHGALYHFEQISFLPKPVQRPHPPIWVGGNSPAALRRLVAFGDAWQPINVTASEMPARIAEIRNLCDEAGRDFGSLRMGVNRGVLIVDDPAKVRPREDPNWPYFPLTATADDVVKEMRQYRDLGLQHVHLHLVGRGTEGQRAIMTRFAREIRPAVDAA